MKWKDKEVDETKGDKRKRKAQSKNRHSIWTALYQTNRLVNNNQFI